MDKLTMAHQCAMKLMKLSDQKTIDEVIDLSWCYAEKMNERNKLDQKDGRLLTKDEDGNCLHFHQEFGHKKCMDCGESLGEWQPDWSKAPDNADSWTKISDSEAVWWVGCPFFNGERFTDALGASYTCGYAPLFDYNGRWQDSLRKRPE